MQISDEKCWVYTSVRLVAAGNCDGLPSMLILWLFLYTPARHFRARNKSYNRCNKLNAMECNWSAWMEIMQIFFGIWRERNYEKRKVWKCLIKHKCLPFQITNHETSSASCDMLLRTFGSWWKMLQFKHGTCCGWLEEKKLRAIHVGFLLRRSFINSKAFKFIKLWALASKIYFKKSFFFIKINFKIITSIKTLKYKNITQARASVTIFLLSENYSYLSKRTRSTLEPITPHFILIFTRKNINRLPLHQLPTRFLIDEFPSSEWWE